MSTVTTADVQHLAALSNLQLSEEETTSLQADIETILTYIEQLNELDTTGVEPTYQVTGLQNVWRDDVVEPHAATRETLLALSKAQANHQVKVPKVL